MDKQKIPGWMSKMKEPDLNEKNLIPIYSPVLSGNEKKYLNICIDKGWISSKGNYVTQFEELFAKYCDSQYAVACSSGTAALRLALAVLDINSDDEVIIPTFTMISTALAVSYTRAKPVFVDCRMDNGNIDVEKIEEKISSKTKAIIPVHVYGTPSDMDAISDIAKKHKLHVIEDAAEAIGSEYKGKKIGGISKLSTFSLYVNKIITTGQGGIITTSSGKLYEELKRLNNYYFSDTRHFWHEKIGFNYKMSNLDAAVGVAQIEQISKFLDDKTKIYGWYKEFLKPVSEIFRPLEIPPYTKSNYWHVAYRIYDNKYSVMDLRTKLGKNSIETRSFFIPLHLQPPYFSNEYLGKYPNSEKLAQTGILLPSGPSLKQKDVERICRIILNLFLK